VTYFLGNGELKITFIKKRRTPVLYLFPHNFYVLKYDLKRYYNTSCIEKGTPKWLEQYSDSKFVMEHL